MVTTGELDRTPARGSTEQGIIIVKATIVGTALFVVTAIFAAAGIVLGATRCQVETHASTPFSSASSPR